MSETRAGYQVCERCGGPMRHPPEWFVCPEEGHRHSVCVGCVMEWELGDLSSGQGQTLKACPDTVELALDLMEPEPEAGSTKDRDAYPAMKTALDAARVMVDATKRTGATMAEAAEAIRELVKAMAP